VWIERIPLIAPALGINWKQFVVVRLKPIAASHKRNILTYLCGAKQLPASIICHVDTRSRPVLSELRRSAVRAVGHDRAHPAIMLEIGKERWCRRFTFAFQQTTLDHPRHWLAVIIEQQEREGDLINAPPF
jgi:hypothetical protein